MACEDIETKSKDAKVCIVYLLGGQLSRIQFWPATEP